MSNCVNFCDNDNIITNYDPYAVPINLYNSKSNLLYNLLLKYNISLIGNNFLNQNQLDNLIVDINNSFININTYAFILDTQGIYYAHGIFNNNNDIDLSNIGTLLCENNVNNLINTLNNKLPNNINDLNENEFVLNTFLSNFTNNNLLVNAILNILQQSTNSPKLVIYNWIGNTQKSTLCIRLSINNKIYVLCV
jgi:hypothetical protein